MSTSTFVNKPPQAATASAGEAPAPGVSELGAGASPPEGAEKTISSQICELYEYASYFLATTVDRAKARTRTFMLGAFLAALLFFALCTAILIGLVLTFAGMAYGLAEVFDGRLWLGCLATGLFLLGGLGLCLFAGVGYVKRTSLERTKKRYEQRKADQLARFGRNADTAHGN